MRSAFPKSRSIRFSRYGFRWPGISWDARPRPRLACCAWIDPSAGKGTDTPVFAEWVQQVRRGTPDRDVIQMAWGRKLIVNYHANGEEVFVHRVIDDKLGNAAPVASGVAPEDIASLSLGDEPFKATA
jgi:hypothetical protein